ncbi:hypothetical protein RHMOL_Rhmol06G0301600 [Rhododendron molle]|uniref:Uncharacterized protein n=1 Tax=Rhododendron molle TaxID=49168 RepID=A0ACC0NI37_RHOML|nr:hypothetical protein RHMOL_Rhmol06G0301600 [Rhododendron molle]
MSATGPTATSSTMLLLLMRRSVLEPIVTLDVLHLQELSQDGKQVDVKQWRKGEKNIVSVDWGFITSGYCEQKENKKLHAIEGAMAKRKAI